MNEILGYFFNPEASMSGLLIGENKNKWKEGLKYLGLIIILLGFLTVVRYRISGASIVDIMGGSANIGINRLNELMGSHLNEGFTWITLVGAAIIRILIIVVARFLVWTAMLYLASLILGDKIDLYKVSLISIFSLVVWVAAQFFGMIVSLIIGIIPVEIINQILEGLATLLSYWHLVLIIIGFTISTKSTFLKGGLVVLIIQGILWMLGNIMPTLQMLLG